MNQKQQISSKDWQLLSEYLDGQLSLRDRSQLEKRLNQQPNLREGLDELRQTRSILRSVRMQRVPRNFTLTPAMVRQSQPSIWQQLVPVLNFSSAIAALALVVILAFQFLPNTATTATQQKSAAEAPAAAPLISAQENQAAASGTPQMIIQWGPAADNQPQRAYGMGGGGGGAGYPSSDLSNAAPAITSPGFAVPQPGQSEQPPAAGKALTQPQGAAPAATDSASAAASSASGIAPALTATPEAPIAGSGPAVEPVLPAAPAPTGAPDQALQSSQVEVTPFPTAPLTGSGPILGAQPPQQAEEQNKVVLEDQSRELANQPAQAQPRRISFPWEFPALLGLIAVGAAVASFAINRRARS
jgi:hypothetical protein